MDRAAWLCTFSFAALLAAVSCGRRTIAPDGGTGGSTLTGASGAGGGAAGAGGGGGSGGIDGGTDTCYQGGPCTGQGECVPQWNCPYASNYCNCYQGQYYCVCEGADAAGDM
jgi:hypothetical protein